MYHSLCWNESKLLFLLIGQEGTIHFLVDNNEQHFVLLLASQKSLMI